MKYYVARKRKTTGRIDLQRCKGLSNYWVSPEYAKRSPGDVWQFSKRGAENIINRYNKSNARGWYEYLIIPVSDILTS